MNEPIIIYNIFPRLAGKLDQWLRHAERARELGFTWIFLNPVQLPGFSGSLYSVKDHRSVNPEFLPEGTRGNGYAELGRTLSLLHDLGLRVMVDLVINHTAIDSPLVEEHPSWFRWTEEHGQAKVRNPCAVDPDDPRICTVWGDLAEVDNEASLDKEGLWSFWEQVVVEYLELGFDGFRCDAAYKVPAKLWQRLIDRARQLRPEALFCAETLGCTPREVFALRGCGFDLLFNSSKWWSFDKPWALEQHEAYQEVAPSIAFPESHDTERLAAQTGGLEAVQQQRYAFAAAFSKGVMILIGYELGFRRKLHVVHTGPDSWEQPGMDISRFIQHVNQLKASQPLLQVEGRLQAVSPMDRPTLVLEKRDEATGESMLVVVNKDWHQPQELCLPRPFGAHDGGRPTLVLHRLLAGQTEPWPEHDWLWLQPAEVVYALPAA
ncbi:MAG: alpha-amylase [Deltaproteobacteria bacterium]|nr:alpha-amylase [Deltaproteobacteria bacterium]